MTIGICKFCGQQKELIASHIIPKVLYQIQKNGPVVAVDTKSKCIRNNPNHQNGLKEPLLCKECDTHLGRLDGYINKVLNIEVPKLKQTKYLLDTPCIALNKDSFDIDMIHKFFISLLWRASISSHPLPLGPYETVALEILKDTKADDYNLFVPLIYRRITGGHVDNMTGIFGTKYLGKHAYTIRFPGYEVMVIVNTKHSNDPVSMAINQKQFTKDEILIIDIDYNTPLDYQLVSNLFLCRDNTPGLKRPTGYVPQKPPMFLHKLTMRKWPIYKYPILATDVTNEVSLPQSDK